MMNISINTFYVIHIDNYATTIESLLFITLIQVNRNNTLCPYSSPIVCSVKNISTVGASFNNIDITIAKVAKLISVLKNT